MSTSSTGQQGADSETGRMGVASLSTKRRLETSGANANYPNPAKQPRKSSLDDSDSIFSSGLDKCSSEFLTTSILARTLLTSSPAHPTCNNALSSSPLESLKSSLEALPTQMFLDSLEELQGPSPFISSMPKALRSDLDFGGLLSNNTSLSTVTVLSPIDQDLGPEAPGSEWDLARSLPMKNPSAILSSHDQLITEDENGKSYFNLGPSEATVLAKKSNKSSPSNSPPDQTWTSNSNNLDYLDDSSSSSCESISSEDLFNSCEEYDEASEEEEDVRSYKQQRSTVLHLSLCKLNSFRNQQCAEPSLHRSVLICNTLRHIEQEIRHEDEVKKNEATFLQSRETLPSFWSTNKRNAAPLPAQAGQMPLAVLPQQALSSVSTNSTIGHDPYLSSSLYNDSPYSTVSSSATYDYNSPLRPSQTPFHTPSYNYPESDLSNSLAHAQQSSTLVGFSPSPVPSLLECDSGYGEDSDISMSSYYYPPVSAQPSIKATTEELAETCYLGSSEVATYSCNVLPIMTDASMTETSTAGNLEVRQSSTSEQNKVSLNLECNQKAFRAGNDSESWSKLCTAAAQASPAAITSFAQQESQCGMESLRSDLFLGSTSGHSIHHQLPMDSLISPNYSAT